jgi:hypothetical protein
MKIRKSDVITINKEREYGIDAYLIKDTLTIHAVALYDGGYCSGELDIDLRELLKKLNLRIVEDVEPVVLKNFASLRSYYKYDAFRETHHNGLLYVCKGM